MSPERFRTIISLTLLIGVSVSAGLIALGTIGGLTFGWQSPLAGGAGPTLSPTDFGDLPARLASLEPLAVAQLGLLTLLATPVARVAASVVAFALEGDRLYAAITLIVLAILLTSIFFLR